MRPRGIRDRPSFPSEALPPPTSLPRWKSGLSRCGTPPYHHENQPLQDAFPRRGPLFRVVVPRLCGTLSRACRAGYAARGAGRHCRGRGHENRKDHQLWRRHDTAFRGIVFRLPAAARDFKTVSTFGHDLKVGDAVKVIHLVSDPGFAEIYSAKQVWLPLGVGIIVTTVCGGLGWFLRRIARRMKSARVPA